MNIKSNYIYIGNNTVIEVIFVYVVDAACFVRVTETVGIRAADVEIWFLAIRVTRHLKACLVVFVSSS